MQTERASIRKKQSKAASSNTFAKISHYYLLYNIIWVSPFRRWLTRHQNKQSLVENHRLKKRRSWKKKKEKIMKHIESFKQRRNVKERKTAPIVYTVLLTFLIKNFVELEVTWSSHNYWTHWYNASGEQKLRINTKNITFQEEGKVVFANHERIWIIIRSMS